MLCALLVRQNESVIHELVQGGACCHGVVHEGGLEGVVFVIAQYSAGQGVEADQVSNGTACKAFNARMRYRSN